MTDEIAWDATRLKPLFSCTRKFDFKHQQGWRRKTVGDALTWGKAWHAVMETFDATCGQSKPEREIAIMKACMAQIELNASMFDKDPKELKRNRQKDLFMRACVDYLDKWHDEPFDTVRGGQGQPMIEQHFTFRYKGHLFAGYLDRMVYPLSAPDLNYVLDRKSTGMSLKDTAALNFFRKFEYDLQFVLYTAGARMGLGLPEAQGVLIDAVQVLVGETRFKRFPFKVPETMVLEVLDSCVARIEAWQANPTPQPNLTACHQLYPCEFKGVCTSLPEYRAGLLEKDWNIEPIWNPLNKEKPGETAVEN